MYNHLFASQITRYDHAPSLEVAERRPDSRDNNRDNRDNRDSRDNRGSSRDQAPSQGRGSQTGNMRFFVNIGKDHGLTLKSLLGSISDMVKVDERMIRNVDMKETFSFLEVPEQFGEVLLKTSNPMIIERNVRFELTRSAPMTRPSYGGGDRDRRPSFRSGSSNRNSSGGAGAGFANRSEARPERSFRS
jgi:ATP-dependent RNA helicase DeaD